jgi:hypothetical protein
LTATAKGAVELSGGGGSAVAAVADSAAARGRGDDARRADLADNVVKGIGDEQVAVDIDRDATGTFAKIWVAQVELGGGVGSAVAALARARGIVAGDVLIVPERMPVLPRKLAELLL